MSHINKMLFDLKLNECKKFFCWKKKKVWCNTDKINEQKKKYRKKLHKHM